MYETQNKKVISHLAKSDLKSKKMGNLFIMLTIVIATSLLLVMGLFPGSVKLDMQRQLAQAQDVIYMNITKAQLEKLQDDSSISYMTLSKLGERMEIDDYMIWQTYFDGASKIIKTTELIEGKLPEKKNEVVVPKAYMKKIGKEAKIGTKIQVPFLSGEKEVCVVSGFSKDAENSSLYPILHSKVYAEKGKALKDVNYDANVKIKGAKDMTQSEFLHVIRTAAADAGIPRSHVNENNYFLDTLPEGKLTADTISIAIIGLIILVAGVMVIYSVFYISITGKTREYGQLRTLGMTKKQIRKLVRKEGMILAFRAIPIGLALGGIFSWLVKPNGFSIINTLIMALIVIVVVFVTVLVSIMKPARIAASISPMEAARYSAYAGEDGKKQTKKVQRKITPLSLAKMNSVRNRKKTFVTMVSLGISGILFIGAVTFAVSMNKEKFARQGEFEFGEFIVTISENASETAKHGTAEVQLNNPFTENAYNKTKAIPGVKKIRALQVAHITYDYRDQSGQQDFLTPFNKSDVTELKKTMTEGTFDYEELLSGDKILIRGNNVAEEIFGWKFKVGDKVKIHYYDGKEKSRTYEIAGVAEGYGDGLASGWFILPEEVLAKELPGVDLTNEWIVSTDASTTDQVETALNQIVNDNPKLVMDTLREHRAQSEDSANQMILMIIALVLFVILFSMINLVNTLITNFLSQKTELAMLQSIGMTGSQIRRMVIGEGLVLAIGNVVISLIFGSLLGYGVCQIITNLGVDYMEYQFPVLYSLIYVIIVILVPCIIAFFMIKKFKKQSLVERLREV